jgi:hypothetical protein
MRVYYGGLQVAKNNGLITETERLARTITFIAGANGLVMIDEYLTNLSSYDYHHTGKQQHQTI